MRLSLVEQQRKVESYLQVSAFPSYRLFDQEGRLLDVNADPRNLETFAEMLRRLLDK